jgi:hypothetical protein
MNTTLCALARAATLVLATGATAALAQPAGYAGAERAATSAVIYPAKGQSARQQDRDRYECHDWARRETGHDPSQPAPATAAAPPTGPSTAAAPDGALARGALRGAAVGELVSNDAGRGAAVGMLGSAAFEKVQARQAELARQQQQAAQQQAARGQQRSKYERAFGACMEGRGYVLR